MPVNTIENDPYTLIIARELGLAPRSVNATVALLAEGSTIPFIARYRKEATGTLDEVQIINIRDRLAQLEELDKRRQAIFKSLEERDLLAPELKSRLEAAFALSELEDIYLPFKVKRKTRASAAREKGLEPLAKDMFAFKITEPAAVASRFLDSQKGVDTVEEALAGARDIIAEWINEDESLRKEMRHYWRENSLLGSKVIKNKEDEGAKYKDYFNWCEPCKSAPSHRLLAVLRGEAEGILRVSINPDEERALRSIALRYVKNKSD